MKSERPNFEPSLEKRFTRHFWVMLLAPAALSLVCLLIGLAGAGPVGVIVGLLAFLVGCVSTGYCGRLLAVRFAPPGARRLAFGLLMFVAIGLVNLIVVAAGCAISVSFH